MAGVGLVLSLIFVPTIRRKVDSVLYVPGKPENDALTTAGNSRQFLAKFNPIRVLKQFLHPEILLAVIIFLPVH